MESSGAHPFKLAVLFVVATSGAVGLAVVLHGAGQPTRVREAALVEPAPPVAASLLSLSVADDRAPQPLPDDRLSVARVQAPIEARTQPEVPAAVPLSVMATPIQDEPPVVKALPIALPIVEQSTPPEPAAPVVPTLGQRSMLAPNADPSWIEPKAETVSFTFNPANAAPYEPFKGELPKALRDDLPKAVPIPIVYQAVLMGDNEWLRQLLKAGCAVNDPTPGGDTPLCAAVKARNTDAVELLVLHGADANQTGRDGQTPLALACLLRTERAIPALLNAGANANTTYQSPVPASLLELVPYPDLKDSLRNDRAVTVLMATAARGDVEGTVALLQHGADVEQPTRRSYRRPLDYAAEQGYLFLMRILLGRPADSEPDVLVTVDLSEQKAYLKRFGEVIDKTTVSTGREGFDTPQGRYLVTDKHTSWTSTLYHVEMPYFMRLNCSAIGLHAGYVTGEPASHGCIRLPYDKVKKWFGIVKVGDEVQVVR